MNNGTSHKTYIGYVVTDDGRILVQGPGSNGLALLLSDGWRSWPQARGIDLWWPIEDDDPRITERHREDMGWLVEELRADRAAVSATN